MKLTPPLEGLSHVCYLTARNVAWGYNDFGEQQLRAELTEQGRRSLHLHMMPVKFHIIEFTLNFYFNLELNYSLDRFYEILYEKGFAVADVLDLNLFLFYPTREEHAHPLICQASVTDWRMGQHHAWSDNKGNFLFQSGCSDEQSKLHRTIMDDSANALNSFIGSTFEPQLIIRQGCLMPRFFCSWKS